MVLNIICLHGFTQNSQIFKKKLSKLVKSTKNINLVFMDGPVILPNSDSTESERSMRSTCDLATRSDSRAYWTYNLEDLLNIELIDTKPETKLYHLENSLEAFLELANHLRKVDGIIGFSQGGCFADYICKLHANGKIPFDLKFAIFVASKSFDSSDFANKPTIKTLHMYGESDTIIPNDLSKLLCESYDNKIVYVHKGAHIVPSTSSAKIAFKNFVSQFE